MLHAVLLIDEKEKITSCCCHPGSLICFYSNWINPGLMTIQCPSSERYSPIADDFNICVFRLFNDIAKYIQLYTHIT